ncbi:hypothetical protein A9995_09680 [Erythrobacter sp. QSSC1-22B]|uniref:NERD domain-containing protein n=1 Tax=Erythrobacter sp. QSSC1-22B TaxID=1860125 RepID=UPI000804B785|nr:NERD domain-containing protein [Erythrobacter sp. QSSC1-22B]OBX18823.1 hypothetical protein A9995_09680 [Erythrobacter sp. QSSC1-22B]
MSHLEIFVGELVEHGSDRMVLAEVVDQLDRLGRPAIVIANLEIGRQLDLVVALDDLTLVIEAKTYGTAVRGSENGLCWEVQTGSGRWKPTGNALRQTIAAKYALRDKMAAFHGDGQGYPEAALVYCPTIPSGSAIPRGDFKAAVCALDAVGRLLTRQSELHWPLPRWREFAKHLGLTRVNTIEAACQLSLAKAELLLATYLAAFRETYTPLADELLPEDVADDGTPVSPTNLLDRCTGGDSILLIGPSGCGKSLWSSRIGVRAADAGRVPIYLYARDFNGSAGNVLAREAALLGAPSLRLLLDACRRLAKPILLLVDGYNECAHAHRSRLTRAAAALCGRYEVSVVVTSQIPVERSDLLALTEMALSAPRHDTKLAIASRQASGALSRAAAVSLDVVKSGLEAKLLGDVSHRVAEPGSRTALFDTYVRAQLGESASTGIRALIAIATLMAARISFSLSVRDLDRLIASEGLPAAIVGELTAANVLTLRGDRASFSHEMFLTVFVAESVVRLAGAQPDLILAAITSPLHAHRAAQIVGSIDDHHLQHAVLAQLDDADVIAECSAGECGSYAQAWARGRIDAVLDRALREAHAIAFEIDETCYPMVRRTDTFMAQWTGQERAVIATLADHFFAGRDVDRIMDIVATLDRKLISEVARLRVRLDGRKLALRSAMFEFCYVSSSHEAPAIAAIAQRLHLSLSLADQPHRAGEIVKSWLDRTDLTNGQLYLLLMLARKAWSDGDLLAPSLPALLSETYRYAPYHLKLDLLHAAHFSWRASDDEKAAIIDALHALPDDQHIFLSSSVVEALSALGALEDSEAEQIGPLRQILRSALERSGSTMAETAYTFWIARFDHPYAGAYCTIYDELGAADRKQMLEMAAGVAPLDASFCGPLMVELAEFGDPLSGALVARWLALPPQRCVMPQDAIKHFLTAHIALARLERELPLDRPPPQLPSEAALAACGEILYWLNRLDLASEDQRGQCSGPLAILARHKAGAAPAALYEIGRCYIGEGLDRLPGAMAPRLSFETEFRSEVASIFRQCLQFPELQIGYFSHTDLQTILNYAISGMARVGDVTDLATLRALVASPTFGRAAVRAVNDLEARLLDPALPLR